LLLLEGREGQEKFAPEENEQRGEVEREKVDRT
jgi:hypothetical protein